MNGYWFIVDINSVMIALFLPSLWDSWNTVLQEFLANTVPLSSNSSTLHLAPYTHPGLEGDKIFDQLRPDTERDAYIIALEGELYRGILNGRREQDLCLQ